jgi:hypothetical protein
MDSLWCAAVFGDRACGVVTCFARAFSVAVEPVLLGLDPFFPLLCFVTRFLSCVCGDTPPAEQHEFPMRQYKTECAAAGVGVIGELIGERRKR